MNDWIIGWGAFDWAFFIATVLTTPHHHINLGNEQSSCVFLCVCVHCMSNTKTTATAAKPTAVSIVIALTRTLPSRLQTQSTVRTDRCTTFPISAALLTYIVRRKNTHIAQTHTLLRNYLINLSWWFFSFSWFKTTTKSLLIVIRCAPCCSDRDKYGYVVVGYCLQ